MQVIGRYRIVRKLGEGGMGAVYAAHDDRLDRHVAIKTLHRQSRQPDDRQRLWREARAGASVSHPHVCQIYEIGEEGDELFIAMELLDGEPLSARLSRGALPVDEASQTALAVLSALDALHQRGIVHRDLKPSNIFLSRHGVKLLDFGVARPLPGLLDGSGATITLPGVVIGTPRYMAPEQIEGGAADTRSDLFAAGVLFYEMLSGQPPFAGDSIFGVAHAILHDEPPALGGSASIIALDRVIHRALRKRPEDRYPTATAFAHDIRAALVATDVTDAPPARPLTRLVVLPFRLLRPNPETDFLAFSLADEISSALADLPSLVVRSTVAASPFMSDTPDIRALASALEVDVVLLGTLLQSEDRVRVNAQLVQAPSGTVVRAITLQASASDIFQLQDRLARAVVEALSPTLPAHDQPRHARDAPANAAAYECYLRANQIAHDARHWSEARDLYLRCVNLDPRFAPAWAQLGRCYRLLGKFGDPVQSAANRALAEDALSRALAINPDLSLAHHLYTYVEVEAGRARQAMVRLLERARHDPSQPQIFAGLVHACRYCGLLDASEAAADRAGRLDPALITSVAQTYLVQGNWERAIAADRGDPPFVKALALVKSGRPAEGLELLQAMMLRGAYPLARELIGGIIAVLQGRHDEAIGAMHRAVRSGFRDPEGLYQWAGALVRAGDHDGALALLERSIEGGYHVPAAIVQDPWFDPLRGLPDFRHLVHRAEELRRQAADAFREADGPRVLGVPQLR